MRFRPSFDQLDARICPAFIDISPLGALTYEGGEDATSLTVAVSSGVYSFWGSNVLTLGGGALAANWRGSGTTTVSGTASAVDAIDVTPGGGPNVVNLRSVADPTAVHGGAAPLAVNVSSNAPFNTGSLSGIAAPVTVDSGSDTSLSVADVTAAARPGPVVIDPAGVHGLAPVDIAVTGVLSSLKVRGSNSSLLAESFELAGSPAVTTRLDTFGGPDAVTVTADTAADVYLGTGDDLLTVPAGVTLTGDVHTGGQAGDLVLYGPPVYGTITGTVGP